MPAGPGPAPEDLVTPEALEARAELGAVEVLGPGEIESVRRRHPALDPAVVSALASQAALSARAGGRLGGLSATWVLDDEALQQATRLDVARYRASELARRTSARSVADLGCGLGVDAYALADAGFTVHAVEQDPWRAAAATINLAAMTANVTYGDALTLPVDWWQEIGVAYVDPARRGRDAPRDARGGRSRALADPEDWSPPWSWIRGLADRMPVVVKAAPGIDVRLIAAHDDIEWVDHDGDTVEATLWTGPLGHARRRATALKGGLVEHIEAPRSEHVAARGTGDVGTWLIEPGPAVRRARLVDALAHRLHAGRLTGSDWLTSDAPPASVLAKPWSVIDELPWTAKELRARLRDAGPVTWKTTDVGASATAWDRRVSHRPAHDGPPVTLVVTAQRRVFAVEALRD